MPGVKFLGTAAGDMVWSSALAFGVKPAGRELLHGASAHFLPGAPGLCCPVSLPDLRGLPERLYFIEDKKPQVPW